MAIDQGHEQNNAKEGSCPIGQSISNTSNTSISPRPTDCINEVNELINAVYSSHTESRCLKMLDGYWP